MLIISLYIRVLDDNFWNENDKKNIGSSPILLSRLIGIVNRHKLYSIDNPKHKDFQIRKFGISPHCFNLKFYSNNSVLYLL